MLSNRRRFVGKTRGLQHDARSDAHTLIISHNSVNTTVNKREHIINGVLIGIGVGVLLSPTGDKWMVHSVFSVAIPVTLGALVPDIDTEFGKHRKTLHNVFVLAVFAAFPFVYGNLQYVWIGVLTHFVLDYLGSKRGIALFYPLSTDEWNFPFGVKVTNRFASIVTILVTVFELTIGYFVLIGSTVAGVTLPL